MPAILKSGALSSPGGKRKGAGRLMGWQKELCDKLIYDRKLIPRLAEAAEGKEIFSKTDIFGRKRLVAADPGIQVMAVEKLMDRAWGKATAEVKHSGLEGINILAFIQQAEIERGLQKTE